VDKNPALATFLSPKIGYIAASKLAKQALDEGRSVREVALEKGLIESEDVEKLFDTKKLVGKLENRRFWLRYCSEHIN